MDYYPLELLPSGHEARIVDVCGDVQHVHRLAEIGIRSGSQLRMIRTGEPCLLAVDGRRMSLRLDPNYVEIFVSQNQMAPVAEAV